MGTRQVTIEQDKSQKIKSNPQNVRNSKFKEIPASKSQEKC